jgi:uncharacterized protein YwqG
VTDIAAGLAEYRAQLDAAGLGRYADSLCAAALPGIRLLADSQADAAIVGTSRLGGSPDLPAGLSWPVNGHGTPLSFIAQLDLAEISAHDTEGILPGNGLLSFFYEAATQMACGFDPADHGAWAVIHTAGGTTVEPRQVPDGVPAPGRFPAVGLRPHLELTFAPWESFLVERLDMTGDEGFAYAEMLPPAGGTTHRLLGHPDPLQGDMQLECQLVTHGLYCGDESGYRDPRAARLAPGAADWRLLFQVDSQDEAAMMWGDVGRLYYWIKKDDLIARNWDQTWLILQCC